jgi:hypothetical protein
MVQQQQRPRGGKEKRNYHRIRINRYDKLLVVSTMSAVLLVVPCSVITTVMDGEGAPLSPVRIFRYNKIIFFSFFFWPSLWKKESERSWLREAQKFHLAKRTQQTSPNSFQPGRYYYIWSTKFRVNSLGGVVYTLMFKGFPATTYTILEIIK